MQTERVILSRKKALELYRTYKTHQHYSAPIDREIQRAYQLIAQGRVIIKALESIKLAGIGEDKLPLLAICRADQEKCELRADTNGSASFSAPGWHRGKRGQRFGFDAGSFPGIKQAWRAEALVPIIPIHLRPKRGLANYHVLWEAEWTKIVPRDPMLLRRVGGDLWLVVAAWDLTEVERAALATRLNG